MSTHRLNNDIPLPHASLLAYLRLSAPSPNTPTPSESAPPPYSIPHTPPRPNKPVDEERSHGFWSSSSSSSSGFSDDDDEVDPIIGLSSVKRDTHGFYAFWCFWCAVSVCILGALGVFFTLDIVFSTFGMGTGVGRWITRGEGTGESYDIHFCLATPNRAAPGPQTWRYISPANIKECTTEIITLTAKEEVVWKLRFDDEGVFPRMVGYERNRRELSVEEKIGMLDLGDDVAMEGEDGFLGLVKWEERA